MRSIRHRSLSFLTAFLVALSLFAVLPREMFTAEAASSTLSAKIEKNVLSWNSIKGASYYSLTFTCDNIPNFSGEITTPNLSYDLGEALIAGGIYDLTLVAKNSYGVDVSNVYTKEYIFVGTITGVKITDGHILSWNAFKYANQYADRYYVAYEEEATHSSSAQYIENTVIDINELLKRKPSGKYTVWIVAKCGTANIARSNDIDYNYVSSAVFITKTDVTVDVPIAGDTPDTKPIVVLNNGKASSEDCIKQTEMRWFVSDKADSGFSRLYSGAVFEVGKYYKCQCLVYLNDNAFLDDYTQQHHEDDQSTFNGQSSPMYNVEGLYVYRVEAALGPAQSVNKLTDLDIGIIKPVAGERVGDCDDIVRCHGGLIVQRLTQSTATENQFAWKENGKKHSVNDLFEAGHHYSAVIQFRTISSCVLSKDVKVTIAGVPAEFVSKTNDQYGNEWVTYAADFLCTDSTVRKGDVNNDGVVDVTDLTVLARSLAHWPGYDEQINEANADIDGKDGVTDVDYPILARALARWPGYAEDYGIVLP